MPIFNSLTLFAHLTEMKLKRQKATSWMRAEVSSHMTFIVSPTVYALLSTVRRRLDVR